MNLLILAARGLSGHRRAHLGLFLGVLLSSGILSGALSVGDSVRYSLRRLALDRLGETQLALGSGNRFFRAALAQEMEQDLQSPAAPAILLPASVSAPDRDTRAPRAQLAAVDARFWKLLRAPGAPPRAGCILSPRLARRLEAAVGDELLLRLEKPGLLSRDAPLSTVDDASISLRLPVEAILPEYGVARFGLQAEQIPPENLFVPLERIARELEQEGRANLLLIGKGPGGAMDERTATAALNRRWKLDDAGLTLRPVRAQPGSAPGAAPLQLSTGRVFIDPPAEAAARRAYPHACGILTYLVNELSSGLRAAPYSMVTAMDCPPVPPDLLDDEVIVNDWLARDLSLRPGSLMSIRYYVMGKARRLVERSSSFRVRGIVPLEGPAADPELMPPFPGVAGAENCRDWEPGIPLDTGKIRERDEEYWDLHRGTPKAFISLQAGRRIWGNRWGSLTAIRFSSAGATTEAAGAEIRKAMDPAQLGLTFTPVRRLADSAATEALDFGQLFLGFSFFLILAALLLTALLFGLGVEARSQEIGLLLGVGLTRAQVRRLLLLEGVLVALPALIPGVLLGLLYTRLVIDALTGRWSGAVAGTALQFHWRFATVAGGAAAAFAVTILTIWWVCSQALRRPAARLLAGPGADDAFARRTGRPPGLITALLGLAGAAVLGVAALLAQRSQAAGLFFGAGALLLAGFMGLARLFLDRLENSGEGAALSLPLLALRGAARRRSRSLSAIALFACGSFLVTAVGASRHDPAAGASERSSGTGGFAFYAESSLPVYTDLNSSEGRAELSLDEERLKGTAVAPMRLREGDQATCLNLNRAQTPRLLGVDAAQLSRRRAFTFSALAPGVPKGDPWQALVSYRPGHPIPAVGDENTVLWSLGLGAGRILVMRDSRGRELPLRIVGTLAGSILQGGLLIPEAAFEQHFPDDGGYRVFLIDAPPDRAAEAAEELSSGLETQGFDLMKTAQRLEMFSEVENTYLNIFALLGGLGLILGSLGLGIIVARNVLERRSEFGLLQATGFRPRALSGMVFAEHALLLLLGLGCGAAAAILAVAPALGSAAGQIPWASLALSLGGSLAAGLLLTWIVSLAAVREPALSALRTE